MYDYIVNPVNGKKFKTNTRQGKAIIEKYRKEYNKKQQGGNPPPFFNRSVRATVAWSHDMFFNLAPFISQRLHMQKNYLAQLQTI